jgi:hypothetical protein
LIVVTAALVAVLAAVGDPSRLASTPPSSTTTTPKPVQPPETGLIPIADEDIERVHLALFGGGDPERTDDDEVVLLTLDGTELGRGPLGDLYTNDPHLGVDFNEEGRGVILTMAGAIDDPLPGCGPVHGAGGLRATVCGPDHDTDEIWVAGSDGNLRLLSGPAGVVGHWAFALPSPDGRWVLAQWSAECEVPQAYLVNVRTGQRRPVVGGEATSTAMSWTPDNRAVIGLPVSACGVGFDQPGTYLVEPKTGRRSRLHAYWQGFRFTGDLRWVGNRLERVMVRAHRELDLEYCCNQPSHGGGDAEDGFVFEGHEVEVLAVPLDELHPSSEPRPGRLSFTCGQARYFLFDYGPEGSTDTPVPNRRFLERAAARLVPGLYCSPGPTEWTDGRS